jgi:replicative DNA helicase
MTKYAMPEYLDRPLPSSAETERIILGAVILDNKVLPQAVETLKAEHFYSPHNRQIFAAMIALFERRETIDPVMIGEQLKLSGALENYGGIAGITNLTYGLPHFSDISEYCKIIREKAQIRELIKACNTINSTALAEDELPEETLEFAQELINDVCTAEQKRGFLPIGTLAEAALHRVSNNAKADGKFTGLQTGFRDWDELTGGLQKTALIIIAGRPGMGKSSLAVNIADNVCNLEPAAAVAIFSLEMSAEQYADRMLCSSATIDLGRYRTGFLNHSEWENLANAAGTLDDYKIEIDDTSSISTLEMRSKLMRFRAEHRRLDLVIVDYLQRMASSRKAESRQQEVSQIARELKSIAKDFECPVIALSSLSRECEKRNPPRPKMPDLRESGDIESEADQVCFIYRPDYYDQREENAGFAEFIIDKHRHGPTATIKLAFMKEFTKFANFYGE